MTTIPVPDLLRQHTELLLATVDGLTDARLREPSRCAGWTCGHVVTHLARNAEALSRVVDALVDGVDATMYTSDAARDQDIDDGAGRPHAEQLDDLRRTAQLLSAQVSRLLPEHAELSVARTPGSDRRVVGGQIALMRLNEVVLHHIDLDTAFDFREVDGHTVDLLLEAAGVRAAPDSTEGFALSDGTVVEGDPRAVLGYATRQRTDGVTVNERTHDDR